MTDDENQQLDEQIVDQDRQAQLPDLADAVLSALDWERQAEAQRTEEQVARQMADLERELWGGEVSTLLTELVRKQVGTAFIGTFSRTIDKVVEDMTNELLRFDPDFRKELEQLVRAAFQQALQELNEPAPEKELPEYRHRQLDRLEQRLSELERKKSL